MTPDQILALLLEIADLRIQRDTMARRVRELEAEHPGVEK